jgi:hypothetical protein
MAAARGSGWGFLWILAKYRLEAQFFSLLPQGLNNLRGGENLLF